MSRIALFCSWGHRENKKVIKDLNLFVQKNRDLKAFIDTIFQMTSYYPLLFIAAYAALIALCIESSPDLLVDNAAELEIAQKMAVWYMTIKSRNVTNIANRSRHCQYFLPNGLVSMGKKLLETMEHGNKV